MEHKNIVKLAKKAIDKDLSYEDIIYWGELFDEPDKDELIEHIWDLVLECKEIGPVQWEHKYGFA